MLILYTRFQCQGHQTQILIVQQKYLFSNTGWTKTNAHSFSLSLNTGWTKTNAHSFYLSLNTGWTKTNAHSLS